jgi:hypothetical protein
VKVTTQLHVKISATMFPHLHTISRHSEGQAYLPPCWQKFSLEIIIKACVLLDVPLGSASPHVCYKQIKASLCMQYRHTGEAEVLLQSILTLTLVGGNWSTSRPGLFTPGGNNPC